MRVENAHPAIVSKAQFRRVNRKLRSRAPKRSHPRRVGSSYLLSGLVRCKACNRALSGQDAKSGKFAYYVCQSVMKRGSGACDAPRLNARRFEEQVVGKIRENVLTESNIRDLVKLVDEEMDGIAKEQRQKLQTIEAEMVDVKRRLGRLYDLAETTDLDIDDFKPRIRGHRERQERLEATAEEAMAMLSQRRDVLDDVETITAYAQGMSEFLNESELTERRAFIESFVKEIVVMPDNAVVRYTIPISRSTTKTEVLMGGGLGCRWEWWNWSWRLIPWMGRVASLGLSYRFRSLRISLRHPTRLCRSGRPRMRSRGTHKMCCTPVRLRCR